MASLRDAPVELHLGFDGDGDETDFAHRVAQRYGTTHRSERDGAIDYVDAVREHAAMFGEPC